MAHDNNQPNHGTDARLSTLLRRLEDSIQNAPPEVSARQRILTERRNGSLYVEVSTSFRISDNKADWAARIQALRQFEASLKLPGATIFSRGNKLFHREQ